ncbi:divergent polysaccharide deacetylase family protein [Pelosinus propionicus]|uniref:Divergent polysaccharide deacetylase n=1 Tax=Pelosinus propionicus DSM 13327 TaxID=1123291 RepID=A0A1I4KKH3_9FIRM|nr:divergent polysaccharide deacetylase family protein [Pelosinus propionicus]SFL79280.1 hypothetical protein SAMN04490355_101839 [Pelosinus propionicus DSM 13327]
MAKVKDRRSIWLVIIVALIMVSLYVTFFHGSNQQDPAKHNLEKTGAGAVVDFTDATKKIHIAVDSVLAKKGFSAGEIKELTKEVPRKNIEGSIRWHTRQLLITVPAEVSVESIKESFQLAVHNADGQIFSSQPDTYQGVAVVRIDIGLKDQLAKEDVTIISDRVYLTQGKPLNPKASNKIDAKYDGSIKGKMAIIIDDFGYNKESISAFAALNRPITFAVIPYRPFSNEAAAKGLSSGNQVILHLPMEPLSQSAQSEELTVSVNMSDEEIQSMVKQAIQSVPGIIGVNNHQGSRATADRRVMKDVLAVLKANHLFFVDSRTNSQSIAAETAKQMGIQTGENQLFLDNTDEVSAVKAKLRTALDMASQHGTVTVIGHARMNTAIAVKEMIPEIESQGIQLVFVSQLLQ